VSDAAVQPLEIFLRRREQALVQHAQRVRELAKVDTRAHSHRQPRPSAARCDERVSSPPLTLVNEHFGMGVDAFAIIGAV
jgi:hypothetical protein